MNYKILAIAVLLLMASGVNASEVVVNDILSDPLVSDEYKIFASTLSVQSIDLKYKESVEYSKNSRKMASPTLDKKPRKFVYHDGKITVTSGYVHKRYDIVRMPTAHDVEYYEDGYGSTFTPINGTFDRVRIRDGNQMVFIDTGVE